MLSRSRPQTANSEQQYAQGQSADSSKPQLKAIRYEDAPGAAAPILASPTLTARSSSSQQQGEKSAHERLPAYHRWISRSRVPQPDNSNSPQRSPSAPPPRPPRSPPHDNPTSKFILELKRDSGIAPSVTSLSANRRSYAESQRSGITTGSAVRDSVLPTILVAEADDFIDRGLRVSSSKKRRSREVARLSKHMDSRASASDKMGGFRGIDTEIPTGESDDIGLADLTSDKLGFSKRGSMIFGGKRLNTLRETSMETPPLIEGDESPVLPPADVALIKKSMDDNGGGDRSPAKKSVKSTASATRRKPNVSILQANAQTGRLLSNDEVAFSQRVRSMYESGSDDPAHWTHTLTKIRERPTPDNSARNSLVAETAIPTLSLEKPSRRPESMAVGPSGKSPRASYIRNTNELAGGIEDWNDVHVEDVDRYGFITAHKRVEARASVRSLRHNGSVTAAGQGATSLHTEDGPVRQGQRKLVRPDSAARSARSARSVPPKPRGEWTTRRGPSSVHSTRSSMTTTSVNPFRSRDKRALAEASDMLTLPPGLADIAEQDDNGQTASARKKREWSREQKWQRMAKPITDDRHGHGKGGGMRFEFDTSDPKLIERVWKGIPDRWRSTAWHSFLSTSARKRGSRASDEELIGQFHKLQEISSADDVQIDVDVPRTVGMHIMFRRRYRGGQRLLFRVLHAISLYFPTTGYVQGMASLAATLLCYYDEEHAFVMMVRLWQLRGLERLFAPGFVGLMAALAEFEKRWLGGGDVAEKLDELSITSTAYGTRWYLTLFNMSIPFPAQLRVWDVFMLLGDDVDVIGTSSALISPSGGFSLPNSPTTSNAPGSSMSTMLAHRRSHSATNHNHTPQPQSLAVVAEKDDRDRHPFSGADLSVLHATSAALIDAMREIIMDSDFENAMKVLTSFVNIRDEDLLMRVARVEWKLGCARKKTSRPR